MKYTFDRHEPLVDRIIFALTLDLKKQRERVLIGAENNIALRLKTGSDSYDVFYDRTRPLGTILATFTPDTAMKWDSLGFMPLWNALHTNRREQPALEKIAADFLRGEFESGDPLSVYAALRIWEGYLRARMPRDRARAAEAYQTDILELKDFLIDATEENMTDLSRANIAANALRSNDIHLNTWYPTGDPAQECVVVYNDYIPLLAYYHNRLSSQGLVFRRCKVCGRLFLAASARYELCSEKCRKTQNRQNKRDFDARAVDNGYDLIYKRETQHWRNLLNAAKKNISPARLQKMQSTYETLRKEALRRKNEVKAGKATEKEFADWIYAQGSALDK